LDRRVEHEMTVIDFRPAEAAATSASCSLGEYLDSELVEVVE